MINKHSTCYFWKLFLLICSFDCILLVSISHQFELNLNWMSMSFKYMLSFYNFIITDVNKQINDLNLWLISAWFIFNIYHRYMLYIVIEVYMWSGNIYAVYQIGRVTVSNMNSYKAAPQHKHQVLSSSLLWYRMDNCCVLWYVHVYEIIHLHFLSFSVIEYYLLWLI